MAQFIIQFLEHLRVQASIYTPEELALFGIITAAGLALVWNPFAPVEWLARLTGKRG